MIFKFSVYALRHLKVKQHCLQNECEWSPTLFFNFYLSFPSRIKKPRSHADRFLLDHGMGWDEDPWRRGAARIQICGERKYDYPEGMNLKMNLLNYGSPCVHKMCISLCFIISFRNHLLHWIREEKVKKSRTLYLKNLSCLTIGLESAINLSKKGLYCRQLMS